MVVSLIYYLPYFIAVAPLYLLSFSEPNRFQVRLSVQWREFPPTFVELRIVDGSHLN
jgi:hypothetical protein